MKQLASGLSITIQSILISILLSYNGSSAFTIQTKCYSSPAFKRQTLYSTAETTTESEILKDKILSNIKESKNEAIQWVNAFELSSQEELSPEAAFYALFHSIRKSATLGLKGKPFHLKSSDVAQSMGATLEGFFSFNDLKTALSDDFLDASYGSTNNAKGWKASPVSIPTGTSFEEARMSLSQVDAALQKGTVIFNTAGSHIPKLASSALACSDASSLPCALNMYVTKYGKKTSAPPHTDKQDVIIVQMQGKKHWRVYTPPNPANKPNADMYARGKNNDDLPLNQLTDPQFGCEKLLDVILEPGDVLFIPAPFPHTTDTTVDVDDEKNEEEKTSIHLTFNFDTHVWDLNYLSIRRLALRKSSTKDIALGQDDKDNNPYVGNVNLLPKDKMYDILQALPLDFLDDTKSPEQQQNTIQTVIDEAKRISKELDLETYNAIPESIWNDAVHELHSYGTKLFNIHRDMYLAAIDEGKERASQEGPMVMTQERIERLSCFRVPKYFDMISECQTELYNWSIEGTDTGSSEVALPENWEFTLPLKVGDDIEADLGGAFFPAKVTAVVGAAYNVQYFDGDVMNGLPRDQIKLLNPPTNFGEEDQPPPGLTKKELKRWRKKQEKKNRK